MKLLKKINNNYALGEDSKGETIIVEGRGVGFIKMPCEFDDFSRVSRTYYGVNNSAIGLIQTIDERTLHVAEKIYDYAINNLSIELSPNLPFTLADHIDFCLERMRKKIKIETPLAYDVKSLYPSEYQIAEHAMKIIKEDLNAEFDASETVGIALNIINSEVSINSEKRKNTQSIIDDCTKIIEKNMNVTIDCSSYNYSRFVTHMQYLLIKNNRENALISKELLSSVRKEYPELNDTVEKMATRLSSSGYQMDENEKFYLLLHVQRLCDREDCNRKGITSAE